MEVEAATGEVVVREGEQADAFYAVLSGELGVSAVGEAGAEPARLRTLGAGTYFGEIGLIGRVPRTATVAAETPVTLLRIEGTAFLDALTNLNASASLLEGAQRRLALTHPSLTATLDQFQPVTERVVDSAGSGR